ncbi:MAG TPA: SGNH/GDSL hydrolase family protein [Kiritimatiellia bacterium]|nr:SGNH/GDSL hydrolase family protein [Kiritimatiellia bacterium]HRZ10982.1 SGNH/GDSL hydrolase family protein [Kiritimatiellia bacterium]HSA18555.1 SGNH/GDSL hydrolase family protein [Kiritimatiellia bacterium]
MDTKPKRRLVWLTRTFLLLILGLLAAEETCRLLPAPVSLPVDKTRISFWADQDRQHPWLTNGSNALRVAMLGDSITAGAGVRGQVIFGGQLEWLLNLNRDTPPAMVGVFAQAGTSPVNQKFLLRKALDIQPSLLILGTTVSDLEDRKVPEPLMSLMAATRPRDPPPDMTGLARYSCALARWARAREKRRVHEATRQYYDFLFREDYSGWVSYCYAVRAFRDACRARQIEFMVLVLPPMNDVREHAESLDKHHRMLRRFLAGEQIPCLDLLPLLREYAAERLELVPGVDSHFNELGHRVIAENLFAYLLANNLIPQTYVPQHMSHPSLARLWGAHQPRCPAP